MEVSLSHMLAVIKPRPKLFLGAPRMSLLEVFINGFLAGTPRNIDRQAFGAFHEWLWESKGLERGPFLSSGLIKLTGSDENAFHTFFTWFDEFIRSKQVEIELVSDAEA